MPDLSTGRLCTRKERNGHLRNLEHRLLRFQKSLSFVCTLCCEVCKNLNLILMQYNTIQFPFYFLHKKCTVSVSPSLLSYN
jgi:hypothetical protein